MSFYKHPKLCLVYKNVILFSTLRKQEISRYICIIIHYLSVIVQVFILQGSMKDLTLTDILMFRHRKMLLQTIIELVAYPG